jgi:signal transduction histidine kinase
MREAQTQKTPAHTWKTAAWMAAGLIWILLCGVLLAYRFTLPTDGWLAVEPDGFDSNGFILRQNVLGLPSNLQPGDWVTEIHGVKIVNGLYIPLDRLTAKIRAGGSVEYTILREGQTMAVQVPLGRWTVEQVLGATVFANPATLFTWFGLIVFLSVSFYAFWRRPNLPAAIALMFLASFLFAIFLTLNILPIMVADVLDALANFGMVTTVLLTFSVLLPPALIRFGLTFPHTKPILHKHPWLGFLPYLVGLGVILAFSARIYVAGWIWVGISLLITIGLLVHNGITMRDAISRGQMSWALGGTVLGLGLFGLAFTSLFFEGSLLSPMGQLLSALSNLGFPIMGIGLAVAILRYQLFDIDRIVNRALVYFGLTLSVIVIYVLVVGYLGYLFQTQGSLLIALAATGAVAVLFEPLRRGLQRGVNRLMYGERDEPYELLMRLGQQLESALDSSAGLALTVETVAKALKLPYVALALGEEDSMQVAAQYGTPQMPVVNFPLVFAGQSIGALRAAPRSPHEAFSPIDRQLLGHLARQISSTAHAHLLGIRLEQVRLRLVTERGEARRQLGRDLHDGVGHQLTALAQKLDHAARLSAQDASRAEPQFRDISQELVDLTHEIRAIAHRLYPPELELLGLTGALRERTHSYPNLQVLLAAPEDLPGLPAEIETAVYYITLEALTNISKHAQAQQCQICLTLIPAGVLELEINDNGLGLAQPHNSGVGMLSMHARAVEVGGTFTVETLPGKGTTIRVHIPCPVKGG